MNPELVCLAHHVLAQICCLFRWCSEQLSAHTVSLVSASDALGNTSGEQSVSSPVQNRNACIRKYDARLELVHC